MRKKQIHYLGLYAKILLEGKRTNTGPCVAYYVTLPISVTSTPNGRWMVNNELKGSGNLWFNRGTILARPPLVSSGQSSWLQIQRYGFDSWCYQIIWEVVGLERGPLSFVSTIEELLGRKNSWFGLENRDCGRRDPSRWPRHPSIRKMMTLTSPTSGGRSVGIVRSRTKATELLL
jgi:hypothetical protein